MNVFTVDNASDNGSGSLRQAIEDANATPGTDTIQFAPELSGQEIKLTSGELQISDSVNIQGLLNADDITISGDNNSRIFLIDDLDAENQIDVNIAQLTLTEGNSDQGGGAIANQENLTIEGSNIVNNQNTSQEPTDGGGAIRNSDTGNLTIDQTLISQNQSSAFGGAITNFGVLDLNYSTIDENQVTSGGGGGIDNRGISADITGSLIVNNTNTSGPAGGFGNGTAETTTNVTNTYIVGNEGLNGAGFFVNAGNVAIIDSFVINNQALNNGGGSGVAEDGNLVIENSVISFNSAELNGGGIANLGGNVTLTENKIFRNQAIAGDGGGVFDEAGILELNQNSIFGNNPNDIAEI